MPKDDCDSSSISCLPKKQFLVHHMGNAGWKVIRLQQYDVWIRGALTPGASLSGGLYSCFRPWVCGAAEAAGLACTLCQVKQTLGKVVLTLCFLDEDMH